MALAPDSRQQILQTVAPYTMVSATAITFTIEQMLTAIDAGLPGSLVECGVWKGGCSFAMLLAQRAVYGAVRRPVYMLDSFEGLPPADQRDGPLALAWQSRQMPEIFFDNCLAPLNEVRESLIRLGFSPEEARVVPGWFHETVPALVSELSATAIACLRLDGDWYSSTRICLEHLLPLVAEGAPVLVDDYYAWDGCARAVHAYLAEHDLPYRIKSFPDLGGAYFCKRAYRNSVSIL